MRHGFLTGILLFYFGFSIARHDKIDPEIINMMQTGLRDHHKINISFSDNADIFVLKKSFVETGMPLSERPAVLIRSLKEVAERSQKSLIDFCLDQDPQKITSFTPFWIVNRVIMVCDLSLVSDIAKLKEIDYISLETGRIVQEEPIPSQLSDRVYSSGTAEPGLKAINAHKMWKLGYTGKGRLVYNYDTGVWPDHPAFRDRYLGRRFPRDQCWLGYSSPYPTGKINSHGTHVLGTIAGLVQETSDTLGVAYGAYWIANDFVGTTVGSLPPIEAMIAAFEWALNPDGDINTSNDIPDVINNSWRWYDHPDKLHCGPGLIADLMNAIEAAGIANVFSGGNFGPENTTISSPQRVKISKINTFNVGSVNANENFPYPISDFSSRGPTQCDGSDYDRIHPQVVAPGQMVRSAWGSNGYNTISGTSMASPHVTGALLLLKEAFPFLSGEELLWALFVTAQDLGEPGEDNTFGMGLIDVFAAFNYLSDSWEAVDPKGAYWDLAINGVSGLEVGGFVCDDTVFPVLNCSNNGAYTIDSIVLTHWLTGSMDSISYKTDALLFPGESRDIHIGPVSVPQSGSHELNIEVRIAGVSEEYDLYDNRFITSFIKYKPLTPPLRDHFENGEIDDKWWLYNPDLLTTWEVLPVQGLTGTDHALSMQFFNYSPREKQIDQLILPNIRVPANEETFLNFDVAYAPFLRNIPENRDTFRIRVYEQCDPSRTFTLYEKAGESLISHNVITLNFQPQHPGQWRKESISLADFAGSTIGLVFESVNLKWNNLYISDIRIDTTGFVKVKPQTAADNTLCIDLHPNPARDLIHFIQERKEKMTLKVSLWDAFGKLVEIRDINMSSINSWDISTLPAGVYIFQFETMEKYRCHKSFIKTDSF